MSWVYNPALIFPLLFMKKSVTQVMFTWLFVSLILAPSIVNADAGSCARDCLDDAIRRGMGIGSGLHMRCVEDCALEEERQKEYNDKMLEFELERIQREEQQAQEQREMEERMRELEAEKHRIKMESLQRELDSQQRQQSQQPSSPSMSNDDYMRQYYDNKTPAVKCPKNSRGATATEKTEKPGVMCICLVGFGLDESGTRCVEKKYAQPAKKAQTETKEADDNCMPHAKLSADGMYCDCDEGYEADATGAYCFPIREDAQSTYNGNQKSNWSGELPTDTEENAWYSNNLKHFLGQGVIKEDKPFRPSESATRGELIELIVKSLGIALNEITHITEPSFDDVPGYQQDAFEKAAVRGITKGDGDCLGTHPCYAYPDRKINRAEAATLIFRAFNLGGAGVTGKGPTFSDVEPGSWFAETIRTAGYYCIVRGDSGSSNVRPGGNLNRAEMITMVRRAEGQERYPNCQ